MSADDQRTRTPAIEQVMGEIHEEVRRRRATGELPADLEQELDAVFARFAPAGTAEEDFSDLLDKVERASFVDPNPPVASNLPGGSAFKNAVRRATGFTIQHLTQQVSAFDYAVVRALRRIDERLRLVEHAPVHAPAWRFDVEDQGPDLAPWADRLVMRLAGAEGRVLHADAGDGGLVHQLRTSGLDAYGVERRPSASQAPAGTEIREATALEHLSALADHVLGGMALSGCIDALPRDAQLALIGRAAATLRAGATLAIVGTKPDRWERAASPVVRDLGRGRPLHAETWAHILAAGPFSAPEILQDEAGPTYLVVAVRD